MNIRQYFKPGTIIPIIVGVIIGAVLIFWGEIDDSPGLSLIGIILCIGLLYLGIHNLNKINETIKPSIILPLLFGTIGIIWIAGYFIRGVFDEPPGLILIGFILSVVFLTVGIINIKRLYKNYTVKISLTKME